MTYQQHESYFLRSVQTSLKMRERDAGRASRTPAAETRTQSKAKVSPPQTAAARVKSMWDQALVLSGVALKKVDVSKPSAAPARNKIQSMWDRALVLSGAKLKPSVQPAN